MGHRTFTRQGLFLIFLCTLALIVLRTGDAGAYDVGDFYRLTDTLSCPNCRLDQCYCQELNVPGANLAGANLSRAILRNTNLAGANLSGADLGWADLRGTNLSGANLSGASLKGADLREANLNGANVSGANLTDAHLFGATWTDGKRCDITWGGCCHVEDRGDNHRCCIKGTKCD